MTSIRDLNGLHWAVVEALRTGVPDEPAAVAAKLGLWRAKAAELLEDLERAGVLVRAQGWRPGTTQLTPFPDPSDPDSAADSSAGRPGARRESRDRTGR